MSNTKKMFCVPSVSYKNVGQLPVLFLCHRWQQDQLWTSVDMDGGNGLMFGFSAHCDKN